MKLNKCIVLRGAGLVTFLPPWSSSSCVQYVVVIEILSGNQLWSLPLGSGDLGLYRGPGASWRFWWLFLETNPTMWQLAWTSYCWVCLPASPAMRDRPFEVLTRDCGKLLALCLDDLLHHNICLFITICDCYISQGHWGGTQDIITAKSMVVVWCWVASFWRGMHNENGSQLQPAPLEVEDIYTADCLLSFWKLTKRTGNRCLNRKSCSPTCV